MADFNPYARFSLTVMALAWLQTHQVVAVNCQPNGAPEELRQILDAATLDSTTSPPPFFSENQQVVELINPLIKRDRIIQKTLPRETGVWTEVPFKLDSLLRLANAGNEEKMISMLKKNYGFEVIVASGQKSRETKSASVHGKPENGDFLGTINHDRKATNPFVQALIESVRENHDLKYYSDLFEGDKYAAYEGMFLAPGRNFPGLVDHASRPLSNRPLMILKDFATKETILHEFLHYQVWLERDQRKQTDPWISGNQSSEVNQDTPLHLDRTAYAQERIADFKLRVARLGEEIDVHKFIADHGRELGLSTEEIRSSAQGYWDHLKGSHYSGGMKRLLEETELYARTLYGNPELEKKGRELNDLLKNAQLRYNYSLMNGPPK